MPTSASATRLHTAVETLHARASALAATATRLGAATLAARLDEVVQGAEGHLERLVTVVARTRLGVAGWTARDTGAVVNALLQRAHPIADGEGQADVRDTVSFCPLDDEPRAAEPADADLEAYFDGSTTSQTAALDAARRAEQPDAGDAAIFADLAAAGSTGPLLAAHGVCLPVHVSFNVCCRVTVRYKPFREVAAALRHLREAVAATAHSKPGDAVVDRERIELALVACGLPIDAELSALAAEPARLRLPHRYLSLFSHDSYAVRTTIFTGGTYAARLEAIRSFLVKVAVGSWSSWSLVDAVRVEVPAAILHDSVELVCFGGSHPATPRLLLSTNELLFHNVDALVFVRSDAGGVSRSNGAVDATRTQWLGALGFFDALFWRQNELPLAVVHQASAQTVLIKVALAPSASAAEPFEMRASTLFGYSNVAAIVDSDSLTSAACCDELASTIARLCALQMSLAVRRHAQRVHDETLVPLLFIENELCWLDANELEPPVIDALRDGYQHLLRPQYRDSVLEALERVYGLVLRQLFEQNAIVPALHHALLPAAQAIEASLRGSTAEQLRALVDDKSAHALEGFLMPVFDSVVLVASWLLHDLSLCLSSSRSLTSSMQSFERLTTLSASIEAPDLVEYLIKPLVALRPVAMLDDADAERVELLMSSRYYQLTEFMHATATTCHRKHFRLMRQAMRQNCRREADELVQRISAVLRVGDSRDVDAWRMDLLELLQPALAEYLHRVGLQLQHAIDRTFEGVLKLNLSFAMEEAVARYCAMHEWMAAPEQLQALVGVISAQGPLVVQQLRVDVQTLVSEPSA